MTAQIPRRPDGAWGHYADPSMMSAADDRFCQSCGEDHSDLSIFGHEIEHCKVCGRWEHIAVDGQMGNWPGADRCFECWFKMPLRKRIAWIRWTMTDWQLSTGPTPDELEGRHLPMGDRDEKLETVEEYLGLLKERGKRGGSPKQHGLWLAAQELDRILKRGG